MSGYSHSRDTEWTISSYRASRRHDKADRTEFHRLRGGVHTDDFKADFACDCKEMEDDSGTNVAVPLAKRRPWQQLRASYEPFHIPCHCVVMVHRLSYQSHSIEELNSSYHGLGQSCNRTRL